MTTTDPTPLAEQIAREHEPHIEWEAAGLGSAWRGCSCGERIARPDHRAHIATVTERAVRERVAEAIELYADATWDLIESSNAARLAFEEVAHIARGATDA